MTYAPHRAKSRRERKFLEALVLVAVETSSKTQEQLCIELRLCGFHAQDLQLTLRRLSARGAIWLVSRARGWASAALSRCDACDGKGWVPPRGACDQCSGRGLIPSTEGDTTAAS